MYEEIRSSRVQGPEGPCGRRLVLVPHSGGRPRLVADHTHKEPCTKDRKGGDLFLFTHLTVEVCPFLFIYTLDMEPQPQTLRGELSCGRRGVGGDVDEGPQAV